MSWESTAEYYKLANELVALRLGGLHSCKCIVYSVDFAEIERLQVTGSWDQLGEQLASAARSLQAAGADFLVLTTNTMHLVANHVESAVNIPFLDIRDVTADAVIASGHRRVGLLATRYTMEQPFYRERLEARGLEVVIPSDSERAEIHRVIFEELCVGTFREESRTGYRDIIARLVADEACEGIVLGCTEIELLISQPDSPVPLFPSARIHVEAAVHHALSSS